jgi:hypothetical protein
MSGGANREILSGPMDVRVIDNDAVSVLVIETDARSWSSQQIGLCRKRI